MSGVIIVCVGYFHVSEHMDPFKAIKKFCDKNRNSLVWGYLPPLFGKKPNYFRFFHLMASLTKNAVQLTGDGEDCNK